MVKDGSALERLAEVDTVVFDKTGTLTKGEPRLVETPPSSKPSALATAAAIAAHSRHPLSARSSRRRQALADTAPFDRISEPRGRPRSDAQRRGIPARPRRLGAGDGRRAAAAGASTVLAATASLVAAFASPTSLRPDARRDRRAKGAGRSPSSCVRRRAAAVAAAAIALSIDRYRAQIQPGGKVERLVELAAAGRKVLMVGDGLNDVPALAAAHVSMAPATAADVGRNAADFVFLRDSLSAVPLALDVSRRSGRLIRENLALAIGYNAIARADRDLRLRDAADCRDRHVDVVADRHRQRHAPARDAASASTAHRPTHWTGRNRRGDRLTNLAFLIPVALFLGGLGLGAFVWALRSGQYEDIDGAAERILLDDVEARPLPAGER